MIQTYILSGHDKYLEQHMIRLLIIIVYLFSYKYFVKKQTLKEKKKEIKKAYEPFSGVFGGWFVSWGSPRPEVVGKLSVKCGSTSPAIWTREGNTPLS